MKSQSSSTFRRPQFGSQIAASASLLLCMGNLLFAAEIKRAADAPQPLAPAESQSRFQLPRGFRIELVASEPLLADPTAIAFDADGRIFVCEIHGYNLEGHYDVMELNKTGLLDKTVQRITASKEALEHAERGTYGTVKLLEDTDRDGRANRARVWADRLPPCYGVVPARGGVIVLCAPEIIFLADRDGDGRAEVRETLFKGFGVGELWTRINNPRWGIDNWIYAACGAGSAGAISGPRLQGAVRLGNNTGFRFKPDGSQFEPVSGGTSGFGLALSDWDDRFLVSNQQHALYVAPLPHHYLARNPYYPAPKTVIDICSYGYPAKIYPAALPDPWRLVRSQQPEWVKFYGAAEAKMGLMTAACAPLIYRAEQFPSEYRDNHFSCDPAYNLIHRCILETDGANFIAKRPGNDPVEFLTSTEQWFRPVNLALGPDGALYLVDMYREIIEDYTAIPRYLQQQYGLIDGHDRGRIWRVVYEHSSAVPGRNLAQASVAELVEELTSGNRWRRETAQRLLLERADQSAIGPLKDVLRKGPTAQARLHALGTLDGLKELAPELIEQAVADRHAGVRLHALRRADRWLDGRPRLLDQVLRMIDDPDPKVRLQVAFTLGETSDSRKWPALATLAARYGNDRWLQAAIISSVPDSAGRLLREFLEQNRVTDATPAFVKQLSAVIGARHESQEMSQLLERIGRPQFDSVPLTNCLSGLVEGLQRNRPSDPASARSLSAVRTLLSSPSAPVRSLAVQVARLLRLSQTPEMRALFSTAAEDAREVGRKMSDRQAAIALLAGAPLATLEPITKELLQVRQPLEIQLAAVAALSASDDHAVVSALLAAWDRYSPQVQTAALDAIFRQQQRISALLDAIENAQFARQNLDTARRSQLMGNPDATIRRRTQSLFANSVADQNRKAVVGAYQAALAGSRDTAHGEKLFQDHCAKCHQPQGAGLRIGPDLGASKARADETILLDILQPNDQITVGYRAYHIVTTTGDLFTGVVSAESATSISVINDIAAEQTILRKDVTSMQVSPVSLMPSNFDELLRPRDVADIIAYLRKAPNPHPAP